LQWSRFKNVQLDSKNRHDHSRRRLLDNTKWELKNLVGRPLLECGCGPGRFTELFVKAGADVVAVDMSCAVDANFENNGPSKNLLLLQCDITAMPFFQNKFDYVFCYGVIQHTSNPKQTALTLSGYLKSGGRMSVDSYRKFFVPTGWSTPKYIWRPFTKKMDKEKLLRIVEWYIPRYIGFDTLIRRIPLFGIVLTGLIPIPCWNYLEMGYSRKERIQHAIMDTFDALSPAYDNPNTIRDIKSWFAGQPHLSRVEVFSGSNGVVANVVRM